MKCLFFWYNIWSMGKVFRAIISSPIPIFFDTHMVGSILNRFSKDLEVIDVSIPEFLLQLLVNSFQVLSVFALCIWTTPYFILIMLPLACKLLAVFLIFACVYEHILI
jgi:ABC-type multidrug transport system fused ATPase/permease subunit